MAEMGPIDRLQPCLLDRLTDEKPESKTESRESRIMSLSRYRAAVLRDVSWLLNTASMSDVDFEEFPEIASSVLNFGTRDLCGTTASAFTARDFQKSIIDAVKTFEPRILPRSLDLTLHVDGEEMNHNAFTFELNAELWAEPMSESLYLKTEVDLETGQCRLEG